MKANCELNQVTRDNEPEATAEQWRILPEISLVESLCQVDFSCAFRDSWTSNPFRCGRLKLEYEIVCVCVHICICGGFVSRSLEDSRMIDSIHCSATTPSKTEIHINSIKRRRWRRKTQKKRWWKKNEYNKNSNNNNQNQNHACALLYNLVTEHTHKCNECLGMAAAYCV